MRRNDLIAGLVADLQPVRVQNLRAMFVGLALVCSVELLGFIALGLVRPDVAAAVRIPMFLWKCAACAIIASASFVFAIRAVRPERTADRRILPVLLISTLAAGFLLSRFGDAHVTEWQWLQGANCLAKMLLLSLPVAASLGFALRRGAPTDIAGASWICGLAAGSWGALVYTLECRHDEAAFVLLWYVLGIAAIATAVRLLLPSFIRW